MSDTSTVYRNSSAAVSPFKFAFQEHKSNRSHWRKQLLIIPHRVSVLKSEIVT